MPKLGSMSSKRHQRSVPSVFYLLLFWSVLSVFVFFTTIEQQHYHPQLLTSMITSGKPYLTKTDEYSEMFQTAFSSPFCFGENCLCVLWLSYLIWQFLAYIIVKPPCTATDRKNYWRCYCTSKSSFLTIMWVSNLHLHLYILSGNCLLQEGDRQGGRSCTTAGCR